MAASGLISPLICLDIRDIITLWLKNQFKLIAEGKSPNEKGFELYDIQNDPGETENLADEHLEIVEEMQVQIRNWQESVLNSLTGADYK